MINKLEQNGNPINKFIATVVKEQVQLLKIAMKI